MASEFFSQRQLDEVPALSDPNDLINAMLGDVTDRKIDLPDMNTATDLPKGRLRIPPIELKRVAAGGYCPTEK